MCREVKINLYCIIPLSYVFCLLVTHTSQQKSMLQSNDRIKAKTLSTYKKGFKRSNLSVPKRLYRGFVRPFPILVLNMRCPRVK